MSTSTPVVRAVDLFCGAGGLSYGLRQAGIEVVGGFDIDPRCAYPFEANIKAPFFEQDVRTVTAKQLKKLWGRGAVRILAGCAPCQPFSSHRRGVDTSADESWPLLDEFARLAEETLPDIVTMENVPRVVGSGVFKRFVESLQVQGYKISYKSCYAPEYGLPQHRRRLVLLASRIGDVAIPKGTWKEKKAITVREIIGKLPAIGAGEVDPVDRLHKSRNLSEVNLARIQASRPGGTWRDWPEELRAPCHRKPSGSSFANVYARMEWDQPAPTITTQAHNFGTGRFGHPEQDRAITLREAAMLQGFPRSYRFTAKNEPIEFAPLGRLIGNAVPPPLGKMVGTAVMNFILESRRGRGRDE
ncbi:DNA cytosine methyltransferase [Actinosynnema sp. NPDC023587]|uniref:DNA cytosine methyltransferase n=1 Tax=Actinosynnema sp. NPDC023587 TaxID=3154695 RepID=UPI0033E88EAD